MYMHVPTQWPKARHIFDEESSIQELLAQQRATECDGFRLFFVDSQDDIRIQISDVLTGFLGKYFTFIDATTLPELRSLIPELSNNQRDSLCCLRELIQASDDFSRELSMRVDSIHNCEKSDFFLYSQENHG